MDNRNFMPVFPESFNRELNGRLNQVPSSGYLPPKTQGVIDYVATIPATKVNISKFKNQDIQNQKTLIPDKK